FVEEAWRTGVDVFRIFDSLNWMESIAPCIEHVRKKTGGLAEGSICYTGDILDPSRKKYDLRYYIRLAKDIENAGAHILGVKDMAGLLKPDAAFMLIQALKSEIDIPVHLHTHDTSSIQTATYLKAIEAGVDVVDVALGGLSGLTSQPNFNSVLEMLRFHERENPMDTEKLAAYSNYWEAIRNYYYPFESGLRSGTGEVYGHEIPGGQYSNLKGQAIALGLEDRFTDITKMYGQVNHMFGDIVKVTPSSKVVGDMAQFMVGNDLTVDDIMTKGETISFPESVKSFFRGDLGQPYGGFPAKLQSIVLKDEKPYTGRPNAHLEPIDFERDFKEFKRMFKNGMGRELEITDFLSYRLYPKVFMEAYNNHVKNGNVINVPTKNFLYGMQVGEEIMVELDKGKKVLISLMLKGEPDEAGQVNLFFKINGQLRNVLIKDSAVNVTKKENKKADASNAKHIGSPLQGSLSDVLVKEGQEIKKNQPLFIIEAMKMESTVVATSDGTVDQILIEAGALVGSDDLIITLK
ncbi:biotin/lipoyl-containing protein, partial [Maribacter sp. 4U21]|uniref:biotin/lipoyl-containing protein n=1 Tax=Maribacter sp. 4U21 TaxID=1889779 RepID=UPI0027BB062A